MFVGGVGGVIGRDVVPAVKPFSSRVCEFIVEEVFVSARTMEGCGGDFVCIVGVGDVIIGCGASSEASCVTSEEEEVG